MKKLTAQAAKSHLKAILQSLKFVFVALVIVLPLAAKSSELYYTYKGATAATKLQSAIAQQLEHLTTETEAIAKLPTLHGLIAQNDILGLLGLLTEEKDKRQIGSVAVTDKDGVVLSRTKTVSKRGDNLFLTTPFGRAVAQGKPVGTAELSGIEPRVTSLIAGQKIEHNDQMVGSIFSGQRLNDEFAAVLKKRALKSGDELLFYTKSYGIYGSTIQDTEKRQLIDTFFSPHSDWITQVKSNEMVELDSKLYWLKNIELAGLEGSVAGAIILVPAHPDISNALLAIAVLVSFLLFEQIYHLVTKGLTPHRRLSRLIISGTIITIVSFGALQTSTFNRILPIKQPPYTIYNSTLRFEPETSAIDMDFPQTVAVKVDSGGENLNSVRLKIGFDPDLITVTGLLTQKSFCTLFPENVIDNQAGLLSLTCGLPSPGFKEASGTVVEIAYQAKRVGTVAFTFKPDTQVLANDGLGTNVLRASTDSSYQILAGSAAKQQSDGQVSAASPEYSIVSLSHPNSERWYAKRSIKLVWESSPSATVAYVLDQSPETIPQISQIATGNQLVENVESDGIYYFHVVPVNNGAIIGTPSHYKIKVDTTAPEMAEMKVSSTKIKVGEVIRVELAGTDKSSGVQNNYYLKVDDELLLPIGRRGYVPFTEPGKHQLKLRVYDNAENFTEKTVAIEVGQNLNSFSLFETITGLLAKLF